MKLSKILTNVSLLIAVAGCSRMAYQAFTQAPAPEILDGQVVVKFQNGVSEADRSSALSGLGAVETIDADRAVYLVRGPGLKGRERDMAQDLTQKAGVEFAEPNFRVRLAQSQEVPQDPYFLRLWGLKNFGQDTPNGIEGVEGADIGAMEVWQSVKGNAEIKVAVLDTGIDYRHPDLAANMWVNQKEKDGVPGVDDDGNGYVDDLHGWDSVSDGRSSLHFGKVGDPDPMDDQSHGTHVAGTIGAVGGNGIGVVGVNWRVSLVAVKFLDSNGSGSSVDEYRALQYILANNIDVVNGSYGGGAESKLIESALKEGRDKGILFVFAAGNDAENNDTAKQFPASYPLENIIAVAATDSRDQIADFSNFGQKSVHIAAPGVNILSTVPLNKDKDPSTAYAVYSGTSMASPHVAGAAALLVAADPNLRKKPTQIKERLLRTAEFKPQLAALVSSGGRLSIARAVKNDSSGQLSFEGPWEEIPMTVETPRNPQKRVDNAWEIKVPGAKAIRVHIKRALVEDLFDVALLYDGDYRSVLQIKGEMYDQWSPIIVGDTAYLKFSNSVVSIDNGAPFANFNSDGVEIDKVQVIR